MEVAGLRLLTAVLIVGFLPGCDLGFFNSAKEEAVGTIVMDLSAIHAPPGVRQEPIECFSNIRSVELSITGGRPPVRTLPVEQGEFVVEFSNVRVRPGTVVFTANFLSSNGDVLFSGERTVEIEEDGFQVAIPVTLRNPLVVACAQLRWIVGDGPPDFCAIGNLSIFYIGTQPVTWAMMSPVQAQGTLNEPGRPAVVDIEDCFEGVPRLDLRVTSNFGDIEGTLLPPP